MRVSVKNLLVASIVAGAVGCGSGGSNNDQGVSFSLIGFNTQTDNLCTSGTFVTALRLPISDGRAPETTGDAGVFSCMTVQNHMSTQLVRADRALLSYYVEGASQQPPTTTTPFNVALGPVVNANGPTSTLPSAVTGVGTEATMAFAAVPPQITSWIALNRGLLPEPPFQMTLTVTVSGVTSAGDRIETNSADLLVTVVEDNLIGPTVGATGAFEEETTETDATQVPL